jgi:hypothetical protein
MHKIRQYALYLKPCCVLFQIWYARTRIINKCWEDNGPRWWHIWDIHVHRNWNSMLA